MQVIAFFIYFVEPTSYGLTKNEMETCIKMLHISETL